MKILFASSEAVPLIKTGGLADVSGSLPQAIKALRHDIRLVLPAYPQAIEAAGHLKPVAQFNLPEDNSQGQILQGKIPGTSVTLYLVDIPKYFNRDGGPYCQKDSGDWIDNPQRFAAFCRVICLLARNKLGLTFQPDVVHCNDWQTGLVPTLLTQHSDSPATVFTIHNIAYQGVYARDVFKALKIPEHFWTPDSLEFYYNFSFLKGGIVHADHVTTVSPTYAREIRTNEYGYGLDGVLRNRAKHLTGILNGIDYNIWNPATDKHLAKKYSSKSLSGKTTNKTALQEKSGLPVNPETPLFGAISRIVSQKGIDFIINTLPHLFERGCQCVLLGSGDYWLSLQLHELEKKYPENFKLVIGYDEPLAHQIEAGIDMFLMPSHFEPCGLNQMYSLRYATIPIVGRTGGLIDTVTEATARNRYLETANGFIMDEPSADGLLHACEKALEVYADNAQWRKLMKTAISQDFSWQISAREYIGIYNQIKNRRHSTGLTR
jgi:starch synthase